MRDGALACRFLSCLRGLTHATPWVRRSWAADEGQRRAGDHMSRPGKAADQRSALPRWARKCPPKKSRKQQDHPTPTEAVVATDRWSVTARTRGNARRRGRVSVSALSPGFSLCNPMGQALIGGRRRAAIMRGAPGKAADQRSALPRWACKCPPKKSRKQWDHPHPHRSRRSHRPLVGDRAHARQCVTARSRVGFGLVSGV